MNTDKYSAGVYLHLSVENLAISRGIFEPGFQEGWFDPGIIVLVKLPKW